MIKTLLASLYLLGLFSLFSKPVHADEFGVLGGVNSWMPTYTASSTSIFTFSVASKTKSAFGVYYEHNLSSSLSLEIDGVYLQRQSILSGTGTLSSIPASTSATLSNSAIQIPLIIRQAIFPMLSLGVGFYAEFGTAGFNYSSVATSGGVSSYSQKSTYGDAGVRHTDLGALASARVKVPVSFVNVVGDVRYLMGFAEQVVNASGGSMKNRYLQVYLGMSLPLGGASKGGR